MLYGFPCYGSRSGVFLIWKERYLFWDRNLPIKPCVSGLSLGYPLPLRFYGRGYGKTGYVFFGWNKQNTVGRIGHTAQS